MGKIKGPKGPDREPLMERDHIKKSIAAAPKRGLSLHQHKGKSAGMNTEEGENMNTSGGSSSSNLGSSTMQTQAPNMEDMSPEYYSARRRRNQNALQQAYNIRSTLG